MNRSFISITSRHICLLYVMLLSIGVSAQNVGIGTTTPHNSSMLDVTSTTKGFLPPRMTKAQRDSISTPAEGLLISCTDCSVEGLHQYINGAWQSITSSYSGNFGTVVNPVTGKVWMDRNLGASRVATSSTDASSYGHLYQWGRASEGHHHRGNTSTTNAQATTWLLDDGDNSWDSVFIILNDDWLDTPKDDLWTGAFAENNPCPVGFRLPTNAEWNQERLTWTSQNAAGAFASTLKLPVAGWRLNSQGNPADALQNVGSQGRYWSSTPDGSESRRFFFSSSSTAMGSQKRAHGLSIRCIKD